MSEALAVEAVPLTAGKDGVIRVQGSRVTLDTNVAAFEDGATAEEIAQQFPTLSLAVVYQVIGYYLRHRVDLQAYFEKRAKQHAITRIANESRWPSLGIRERLLARRK